MKKTSLIFLFSLYLPCSSLADTGIFNQPRQEFSLSYEDYMSTKASITNTIKKQAITTDGTLYDRCRDNGLYRELYTLDRRCYLTEDQTSQAPYNAIVALLDPEDRDVYCTGTIVKNPNDGKLYVYTAAHCTKRTGIKPIHVRMQNGNEMDCEPAYVGLGSGKKNDVAIYKISKEYENDVPFVTTGDMQSGYVEIIGYGSLSIMNNNQIQAFHQAHENKLRELDIDLEDFDIFSIRDEFNLTLPEDSNLKGSFHCYLPQGSKPFNKEQYCQSWYGNSGGPIFDENGKLVAILTGGYPDLTENEYAVTPISQEIVSDAEDEFILVTSKSKLRNEAGDCFRITDQNGNLVEESADKCQDIPLGSWSIVLGKGEYSGFAKCSLNNNREFGNNNVDDLYTDRYDEDRRSNCWCKTNGVNSDWERHVVYRGGGSKDYCMTDCTEYCLKDFIEEEKSLTQPKKTKQSDNQDKLDEATVIAHTPKYCIVGESIDHERSNCNDLPVYSWKVTYKDNTKYTGISKCITNDTVFDDQNIDSLPNGNHCWCKLDGTNAKWEKNGWIYKLFNKRAYTYDDCDDICAAKCAETFVKNAK